MATAGKEIRQLKPQPAPNSDFYEVTEILNAEELATLKQVRAFADTKVAPVVRLKKLSFALAAASSRLRVTSRVGVPSSHRG
jgi:hypothetical protein